MKILAAAGVLAACAAAAIPEPKASALSAGTRAYQKCYSCHAVEAGRNDLDGPTLYAIVGREIAAEPFDYSPAMRAFAKNNPAWDRTLLDRFIADPEVLVPQTTMAFQGISDPAERAALIDYLERLNGQTRASVRSLP